MAIVRLEPARDLASMEIDRLNRMFSDLYGEAFSRSAWVPAVDIYETDEHEVVLKAELPEMKREDISVTFENNVLTLKGERKLEQEVKRLVGVALGDAPQRRGAEDGAGRLVSSRSEGGAFDHEREVTPRCRSTALRRPDRNGSRSMTAWT